MSKKTTIIIYNILLFDVGVQNKPIKRSRNICQEIIHAGCVIMTPPPPLEQAYNYLRDDHHCSND